MANMRKYSKRHEKDTARRIGGRVQPNSGATAFLKGDVISKHCAIDCKTVTTSRKSIAVKLEWLKKIEEEAFAMGRSMAAICFNFEPGGENYYVIGEKEFKMLQDRLEELENE